MKIKLITAFFLGMLLIIGCGDQAWCGENGCGVDRHANKNRST